MSLRLFKFAVVILVLAVLVHPIVESMDTWDGVGPTNDTELTVVGLVIAGGLILALRQLLVLGPSAMALIARHLDSQDDPEPVTPDFVLIAFSDSAQRPSVPLRI